MKIYNFIKYLFSLILIVIMVVSCEEPAHEEYMQRNEQVYVGKPDTLSSSPGFHRNKLSWLLVSDPKITGAKVYWTNPQPAEDDVAIPGQRNPGRDSLVVDINRTDTRQQIEVLIEGLTEGVYTFEVVTFDADGNTSIPTQVIGDVYGDTYLSTISNRPMEKADIFAESKELVISWFGVSQRAVVIDVEYTDDSGNLLTEHITKVPAPDPRNPPYFTPTDTLENYKLGTTFRYRTGYLPAPTAIDTFYTPFQEVEPQDPILPDPKIKAIDGSDKVRGTQLYRIEEEDITHLLLTPGITVGELQTEVVSDNSYTVASRVYHPSDLETPLSDSSLIYDNYIIEFYYPNYEGYRTEMVASVFAEYKFATEDGLSDNVTFSDNVGADDSGDRAYDDGDRFPYLQTDDNASAVGGWVAITTNVPAGTYKIDVIHKPGGRGDAELYLGTIAPGNMIGVRFDTGEEAETYLENYVHNGVVTTGHKLSIRTIETMNLTQGENVFIFTPLENNGDYRIVLESIQLRFVEPGGGYVEPENLALGKSTSRSSDASAGRAVNVVDGDYTTMWQPLSGDRADLNTWVTVDLGSSQSFNEVVLYYSKDPHRVVAFEILYSDDDENWQVAYSKNSPPGDVEVAQFSQVTGRYVRLSQTLDSSGANVNLSEFEIWIK